MPTRPRPSRWLLPALASLPLLGCAHEKMAREHLQDDGCTVTSMNKQGKGYAFEATCGRQSCTGTIEVRGTRIRNEIDVERKCVSY